MDRKDRILIVDDIPTNVDILRRILRKDYELETAANGDECLAKVPAFKPQLVLLDIMMPGIDGYEVCRRIKSSAVGQFVQVILVSGKGSTAERVQGYEAQADDYLVKPFDHEELRSKVRVQFRLCEAQRQLTLARDQLALYAGRLGNVGLAAHKAVDRHGGHGGLRVGPGGRLARPGDGRAPATHAALRADDRRGTLCRRALRRRGEPPFSRRPLSRQPAARHRQGCRPRRRSYRSRAG